MDTGVVSRLRSLAALGLAVCALGAGFGARADDDHELARRLVEQGKVLPLRSVLERLERELPGRALKVGFEHDGGRFVYKILLLQPDGRVAKLEVDATDGRVLRIKRRERQADAHPGR